MLTKNSATFCSFSIILIILICNFLVLNYNATAQVCTGEIVKLANPKDNTPFTFLISDGEGNEEVVLMDPDDNVTPLIFFQGSSLEVTELETPGWMLESIECETVGPIEYSVNGNTLSLSCNGGDVMFQCEFNNVQAPAQVPSISDWGLIAMVGILGTISLLVMIRRKAIT